MRRELLPREMQASASVLLSSINTITKAALPLLVSCSSSHSKLGSGSIGSDVRPPHAVWGHRMSCKQRL